MSGQTCQRWQSPTAERYPTPAACKFVSGDDFLRLAMQAYLAAGRGLVPPTGEPWADDGWTWASAEDFCRGLLDELGERVRRAAVVRGDLAEVPWDDAGDESPGCRGGAPAVKGHGCPASSVGGLPPAVAVGPAPVPCPEAGDGEASPGCDITIPDDPLFAVQQRQELPGVNRADNLQVEGELIA